ncbi:MAG: argininosuccinate lyase [Elusimicrobia bacterium RIFOXYA2_FULL_39_19]|nr:MAG: argininosuccinate lyase [Elusimicrobia bacterium RIFOXYA2_FULL_39_19]
MTNTTDFLASFSFDKRLALYDIAGSIAHVKMLGKCSIIPAKDAQKIATALQVIAKEIKTGKKLKAQEDIHFAIEQELIRKIGENTAGKLRTARSRNDQVALDVRLYLKDKIKETICLITEFQKTIIKKAKENEGKLIPGFTHLQPAEPVLYSHYILSYAWMLHRDKERLIDCYTRVDVMPLGSAALAGTSFPIDRKYTAKLLDFSKVSNNSMDSVSDRDFVIEFISAASIIMMHLSRLSEEIITWLNPSFNYIEIADEFTSGSSIMPQKRNPDIAELIRGKTGRVYGALVNILTLMKALPLTYNRDMQEDKPPLFDTVDTLTASLEIANAMLASVKVKTLSKEQIKTGFSIATELANFLVRKGLPFLEAHAIVKIIVDEYRKTDTELENLTASELKKYSKYFDSGAENILSAKNTASIKISYGGSSVKSVRAQIAELTKLI